MLNNLTAPFLAAMASYNRSPIQLAVFHFERPQYLSDRDIVVNGQSYDGLIENWGELTTVNSENAVSSTQEITLTIWNGGNQPFSDIFQEEDPVNVFVSLYQTFEGLSPNDMALLGEFVIQDPIEYSEASQLLIIDLVSTNMRYFGQVGKLLVKNEYPDALEEDLNKPINLIVGNSGELRCICSKKPPKAVLKGSFLEIPTVIESYQNLRELNFPLTGYIQIDDEIMGYNQRDTYSLNITSRGAYGTAVSDHTDGTEILLARTSTEFIVGAGPLASISNIKVGGLTTDLNPTVYLGTSLDDPAKLIFSSQPVFTEYSRGSRRRDELFDTHIDTGTYPNTALFPDNAYLEENRALGALIKRPNNLRLKVQQTTPQTPDGELIGVFLRVDHWAAKSYNQDEVLVFVSGIDGKFVRSNGVSSTAIGRLARPNPQDILDLGGEVNLWHEHDHQEDGANHEHSNVDTQVSVSSPAHLHGVDTRDIQYWPPSQTIDTSLENGSVQTWQRYVVRIAIENIQTAATKSRITATLVLQGGATMYRNCIAQTRFKKGHEVFSYYDVHYGGHTIELNIDAGSWNYSGTWTYLEIWCDMKMSTISATKAKMSLKNVNLETVYGVDQTNFKAATINKAQSKGSVTGVKDIKPPYQVGKVKDVSDVLNPTKDGQTLNEANLEAVQMEIRKNSSRSVPQRFEITHFLPNIDWNWLNNRVVSLVYAGSAETPDVVVTYMCFEVEYRQGQTKTTDLVTCEAVGTLNPRPDAVIQHLLTVRAGVPPTALGSVYRNIPKWDDSYVSNDNDTWQDEGEVANAPAGALFEEAGAWYDKERIDSDGNVYKYRLDGIIPGNITVKDAVAQITWQTRSRLLWQNGYAKLAIKRKSEEWITSKNISTNDIQIKSYTAKRTSVSDIINTINLFYNINRLSDAEGSEMYYSSTTIKDIKSIVKHGERQDDSMWLFDLIRTPGIAEHTADYYLWLLGETYIIYGLKTYLNNFDLEKEDYITLNSVKFDSMNKLRTEIGELSREFGSGKNDRINTLKILARSIRQRFFREFPSDNVDVTDSTIVSAGFDSTIQDTVPIKDFIAITDGKQLNDPILLTDSVLNETNYRPSVKDSVGLSSDISVDMALTVQSNVDLRSVAGAQLRQCFGSCGFGTLPFGSKTEFEALSDDIASVVDSIIVEIGTIVSDPVGISDIAIVSDGFGSPKLGDGFGLTLFGD